VIGQFFTT